MRTSPTKTGEMRVDQYWLLKSKPQWSYMDEVEGRPIEPVIAEKCGLDAYMASPQARRWCAHFGEPIHGRRINDEVELFEDDSGKETLGLRVSLERKGLTVRTYAPQDDTKKTKFPKPDYKAILGKEPDDDSTPLEKAIQVAKRSISKLEKDEGTEIDYALLIDGQASKKSFLVCVVRAAEFYKYSLGEYKTCSCRGVKYPVLAVLECGELRVVCDEKTFMSYFILKKDGDYHVELKHHDFWEDVQREERERISAEKKQAKKHRRQVTQSTVTSPSVESFVSAPQSVEDNEAVKKRQREKNRVKKKAQKERRRAKQDEIEKSLKRSTSDAHKNSAGDSANLPTIYGTTPGHQLIVAANGEPEQLVEPRRQIKQVDLAAGNDHPSNASNGTKKPKTSANSVRSDGESDDYNVDEEDTGMRVIYANTQEDMKNAVKVALGLNRTVMVADLESAGVGVEEAEKGTKYLGRGL